MEQEKAHWPAWYYGPNEQKAIFQSHADIPDGWYSYDERHKVREADAPEPEDSDEAWGGYMREEIEKALRDSEIRFRSDTKTRSLYEKAMTLGLIMEKADET